MKKLIAAGLVLSAFLFSSVKVQAVAQVDFVPASSALAPATAQTVDITLNTANDPIAGFTLFIDITGTLPGDLAFTPATVAGLELWTNTLTDITGGKRLTFGLGSPISADYSNNSPVVMGSFTFTTPASGSLTFTTVNTSEVVHATTYQNLLSSFPVANYTIQGAEPTATPTVGPSATPEPPTATPIPPSPTPLPTPTPAPINISLGFDFRLQGIYRDVGPQLVTFSFKDPTTGALVSSADSSAIISGDGLHHATVSQVPIAASGTTTYKICVKAKSHLQKCLSSVSLTPADDNTKTVSFIVPPGSKNSDLLAGDVNNDNKINLDDWGLVMSAYTDYVVPITKPNPYDLNNDGQITIDDLTLTYINFTDFEIQGNN